jgi:hypothetical protein
MTKYTICIGIRKAEQGHEAAKANRNVLRIIERRRRHFSPARRKEAVRQIFVVTI